MSRPSSQGWARVELCRVNSAAAQDGVEFEKEGSAHRQAGGTGRQAKRASTKIETQPFKREIRGAKGHPGKGKRVKSDF